MRAIYFLSKYPLLPFHGMDFHVYDKLNKNEDASLVQNNKVAQNINNV